MLFGVFLLIVDWPRFTQPLGAVSLADPQPALPPDAPTLATITSTATPFAPATNTPTAQALVPLLPTPTTVPVADSQSQPVTATPEPGGALFILAPGVGNVGWWSSGDSRRAYLNDSFLYAGFYQGVTYVSLIRLDLSKLSRGAKIHQAQLHFTGLRQDRLAATGQAVWLVELLAETALPPLNGADFLTIYSAPASITLGPITTAELAEAKVNVRALDNQARAWLEQQLLTGAQSLAVRFKPATTEQETLFAWDSGLGPETAGKAPMLSLSLGPPPPTPPPLPTKPFIVATPTPTPANVLTVVALAELATAAAVSTGTYTPVPFDILTPTPFPANLATVQAAALVKGLAPVLVETPTPATAAIATGNALYATAVAKTTGTFTPVPPVYVTPFLVLPSPPAANSATEVARVIEATAVAQSAGETATPLPYNAIIAQYMLATPTPENVATSAAQQLIESVYGTPTPLAWEVVVITPSPVAGSPTATPLPMLLAVTDFTPTPTNAAAAVIPDTLPGFVRNKILFRTTRFGTEQVAAFDPATGQLYQVTEPWVYPLAHKQQALAPDGKQEVIVAPDANRVLQIYVHSLEYGSTQQLTAFTAPDADANNGPISYDPAWSPQGNLIAFVSTNSRNDEIYTVTLDGSVLQQLTTNSFEWDKHPTWSPDGRQLVFFSNRETGRRLLWMMDVDGTNQRNLSYTMPNPGHDQFEDWEPIWVR